MRGTYDGSLKLWPSQHSAVTSSPASHKQSLGKLAGDHKLLLQVVSAATTFFPEEPLGTWRSYTPSPTAPTHLHSIVPAQSTCLPELCSAHPHHQPAHSFCPLPACLGCHFSASFHIMVMWGPCLPAGIVVAKWCGHMCHILWPYCLMAIVIITWGLLVCQKGTEIFLMCFYDCLLLYLWETHKIEAVECYTVEIQHY